MNQLTELPNLLLVAGTNRKVGKTTFICKVINQFKNHKIIGIKITPHFHNSRENKKVIIENEQLFISEELDCISNKDSSLMLQNGASKVYYVETRSEDFEAVVSLLKKLPGDIPLICESASLRKAVKPGLMIMIDNENISDKKPLFYELRDKIDVLIKMENNNFNFNFKKLRFENGTWIY